MVPFYLQEFRRGFTGPNSLHRGTGLPNWRTSDLGLQYPRILVLGGLRLSTQELQVCTANSINFLVLSSARHEAVIIFGIATAASYDNCVGQEVWITSTKHSCVGSGHLAE